MVSLGNGIPGNRSGAYFFEDDSDEQSTSEVSGLVRRSPSQASSSSQHSHIATGYLSAVEAIVLIIYAGSLLGLTLWKKDEEGSGDYEKQCAFEKLADKLVAYFSMIHVAVWVIVAVMDRIVQWQHQVLRRKGYMKFYRQMKNIRRIPFIAVSLGNAALLLFVSLLYFFGITRKDNLNNFYPVDALYIIVAVELLIALPCLIYYIVRATMFNCAQQAPDVIHDTYSGPDSPTTSISAVGFRDGEDLDELLERQADMIRYLQQHNANLGRRILELQAQALE